MKGLVVGRSVHYIPQTTDHELPYHFGHLAAIISYIYDADNAFVQLKIFPAEPIGAIHSRDAYYSNYKLSGTWHWIEKENG